MDNDFTRIVKTLKSLIAETTAAMVMSDIEIGEVIQVNPLVVQLDPKTQIDERSILLTKNTSMWSVDMDVDHHTENAAGGSGDAQYESHLHGYKGRKTYRVHNELVVGDKVILLRESGGQRYVAIDRFYNPDRGCSD
ncbi:MULTISPECIES: DUF2577 domain-containing protein [Megasphaera]|uniref:DUF2577 domain-containing protein n=1 Tax=Megasphaera TaxID=906 RepID=UPI0005675F76|nr:MULTISPECIES: DUF2577 domain-containing protein [Megasphaera]